jgi:hypothetical protein
MNSLFGISKKFCLHYDSGYNHKPLAILCHVDYAILGSTVLVQLIEIIDNDLILSKIYANTHEKIHLSAARYRHAPIFHPTFRRKFTLID